MRTCSTGLLRLYYRLPTTSIKSLADLNNCQFMQLSLSIYGVLVPRSHMDTIIHGYSSPLHKMAKMAQYLLIPMHILLSTLNHLQITYNTYECYISSCYTMLKNKDKNKQSVHFRYRRNHPRPHSMLQQQRNFFLQIFSIFLG